MAGHRRQEPPLDRSLIGCSSAALVDRAPEADEYTEPVEGRPLYRRDPARPPAKPSDEIKPGTCKLCGYVPSKFVGPHEDDPMRCIEELRWQICLLGFHPPKNSGPKKRAAAAR